MHYSQISAIHTTFVTFNRYSPQLMLHREIVPHGHEKLHMRVYICKRPCGSQNYFHRWPLVDVDPIDQQ